MKKRIKILLPVLALSLFSCSDYLDINDSSNDPTAEQITPNLSLAGAETNTYRTLARTGNVFGNLFLNNWGFNVNAFAVTSPEEFTLALTNGSYSGIWDGFYVNSANFTNIINHSAENYENHKAIAKILKSFYFQYLVDLYGDIPYTEAHLGSQNLSPAYDDDQAIYRDLVVQLEDAIATIDNPVATTIAVGTEDVIFQGNMANWKKFANTLKLRLLLRQSEMNDAETTAYLAAKFAELAGAEFLDIDATINPGYSNDSSEQQNPWYDLFFDVSGSATTYYNQYGAAEFFANELNSNPTSDARKGKIFELVSGQVSGVRQGDCSQTFGPECTAPTTISKLSTTGVLSGPDQDGYMMLLSESLLLQAEAVHRGYLAGDAQDLFDQAITASFNHLNAGSSTQYISEVNTVAEKGYGAGTSTQKLKAIMYQKKVALTGVNAMEVFIEYTRTGFIDDIDLADDATQPNKMRRLLYPTSELVGNTANVPQLSLSDIFVQGPFWFTE